MPKLESLKSTLTKGEKIDIPDDVPEQFEEFGPPPPPGAYVFQLPESLEGWKEIDATIRGAGGETKAKRLEHEFSGASALTIVQGPARVLVGGTPARSFEGKSFRTRISNVERARDKEKVKLVSDLYYLLKDAFDFVMPKGKENYEWGAALDKHAGEKFGSDVEWKLYCNDGEGKTRYIEVEQEDGTTRVMKDPSGQVGCGATTYQNNLKKLSSTDAEGNTVWPETFFCPSCEEAVLRPYAQLARYRKAD